MLKGKYVITRNATGIDAGMVSAISGGMVQAAIDEIDVAATNADELKDQGAIVAQLSPNVVITDVRVRHNLTSDIRVSVGTNGTVHKNSIVSNAAVGQDVTKTQTTVVNFGVSNKKLGTLARDDNTTVATVDGVTTYTHSGRDVNDEGLVDVVLNATKTDNTAITESGTISMLVYYY